MEVNINLDVFVLQMMDNIASNYYNNAPLNKLVKFLDENPDVIEWGKSVIFKGNKDDLSRIVDEFGGEMNEEQIYFVSERVGDFIRVYIEKKGLFSERVGKMISRGAISYVYDSLIDYFKK